MKGTFKITLAYLKELGACRNGQRAFQKAFPDGGEYQNVLDRCADEGRYDFASWLLDHVGPTEDVRVYDEPVNDGKKIICFAGRVEFKFGAMAMQIRAGCGIEAGEGIKAGCGIEAGEGIKAGCGIEAGRGFGVFAGLRIKVPDWSLYAVVSAETKPDNLISGFWKPLEGHNEETV